jgi:hypothetical protein
MFQSLYEPELIMRWTWRRLPFESCGTALPDTSARSSDSSLGVWRPNKTRHAWLSSKVRPISEELMCPTLCKTQDGSDAHRTDN